MKKIRKIRYLIIVLTFLFMGKNVKSQVYDTIINLSWEKPIQLKKNQILRPENVSKHAYLFEYDQTDFKVYFWVEYEGMIDSVNEIHKFIIYEYDGTKPDSFYYFVVKGGKLDIDINNYQVDCALSRFIGIKTKNKDFTLLLFNYPFAKAEYFTDNICEAFDKENYRLVTAVEFNKNAPDICPIGEYPDVYIKIEYIVNSNDVYKITIQDDNSKFHTANYKLKSEKYRDNSVKPKYPFYFKYYNIDEKRIYLLDKGFYLEQISE
jgi:hypothetical protein